MAEHLSKRKRTIARWATILLTVLALAVAACGGDDSDDEAQQDETTSTSEESSTTTAVTSAIDEVLAEYQSCMADAGADLEADDAPSVAALVDASDRPPEVLVEMGISTAYVDAHGACGTELEAALAAGETLPETDAPVDPELAQQMHEAVACLNDRGWDFLEPGVETGPLVMQPRDPNFDMNDLAFLEDQRECQQEAGMIS